MSLYLKSTLEAMKIKQSTLAAHLGVSPATVSQICNHGIFPKKPDGKAVRSGILSFLESHGADRQALSRVFDEVPLPHPSPLPAGEGTKAGSQPQEEMMLLRKQTLTPAARRHFGLFSDPFADDLKSHEDVFVTDDVRYVRETLWHTARHGGFVAVVGESGAGKSTLRRDLIDRIARENQQIVVIEPYVLGMEGNDQTGKTLKAAHIAEAIVAAAAPLEGIKRSSEARFRQVHRVLRDGSRAGMRYLLVIEEAHGLPIPTLKHLKRFYELEDGFKKLLSIVLIGQSELRMKLSEQNHEVREVVQRCEIVELMPLDSNLDDYLKFKFHRAGKPLTDVVEQSAIDAIRAKLTFRSPSRGDSRTVSLLYPLAVSNLLVAAMNLTASLGFPKVTGDTVKEA
jgi:type II secretory pathway predicted ATPase ExeA